MNCLVEYDISPSAYFHAYFGVGELNLRGFLCHEDKIISALGKWVALFEGNLVYSLGLYRTENTCISDNEYETLCIVVTGQ